ncbi:hypothetical protein B0J14DRAFT_605099 [Halenospora varia]|nr:hypothetical protein B0J14DRAFT_605099 [Halenospora varia]
MLTRPRQLISTSFIFALVWNVLLEDLYRESTITAGLVSRSCIEHCQSTLFQLFLFIWSIRRCALVIPSIRSA